LTVKENRKALFDVPNWLPWHQVPIALGSGRPGPRPGQQLGFARASGMPQRSIPARAIRCSLSERQTGTLRQFGSP
jgi:hypothetical protein